MTTAFNIQGRNGNLAEVTNDGAITIEQHFSSAEKITLIADNTALTFISPRSGEKMIITGLIVNTNRDIGVNGTLIQIYESLSKDSSVVEKPIMSFDLVKNQTITISPINIETVAGRYINAIADDSDVNVTLLCYFEKLT